MQVILIQPPNSNKNCEYSLSSYENLGLEYIAAVLRQNNFKVNLLSAPAFDLNEESILNICNKYNPKIIGISMQYFSEIDQNLNFIQNLKINIDSDIHIAVGGHVATALYEKILNRIQIDSVIIGEGEKTFLDLCTRIKKDESWLNLNGIAYKNNIIRVNQKRSLIRNLDTLPFPSRDTADYYYDCGKLKEIYISSSRGCFYNCSFCDINSFYINGDKWRGRSCENIVNELEFLVNRYGKEHVFCFIDDQFIGPGYQGKERVAKFAKILFEKRINLSFEITCRPDSIDKDLFLLLKKAGLKGVYVGIDNLNRDTLCLLNKRIEPKQCYDAISILADLELYFDIGFIMFCPWTCPEELKKNIVFLEFAIKKGLNLHPNILISALHVYPGTYISSHFKVCNTDYLDIVTAEYFKDKRSWIVYKSMKESWYSFKKEACQIDNSLNIGNFLLKKEKLLLEKTARQSNENFGIDEIINSNIKNILFNLREFVGGRI